MKGKKESVKFEIINAKDLEKMPSQSIVFDISKREILPQSALIPPEAKNSAMKHDCIIPPIDRPFYTVLERSDPTHKTSLDIKSIATSKKGYRHAGGNRAFKKFINRPNYEMFESTFQDLLDAFVYEYFVYDEAYFEAIRVADTISMFTCPVRFVYVKTDKSTGRILKYCYITNSGDVTELEPYRGGELKNGVRYIVGIKTYNTSSSYYGYPAYMSAMEAMIENSFIRRYGISFFNNDATPNKALILTGAPMSKENKTSVKDYLKNNHKGVDNSHKLLLITLDDIDSKAEFVDLSSKIDETFTNRYKHNRDEVVTIHQIPPKLLGISTPSGLSAGSETIGSLRDFVDRIVTPHQEKISNFLSRLFSEMFSCDIKIKLKKIDTTNEKDEAIINNIYGNLIDKDGTPVKTVTEIREEIGMEEKPKGALHDKKTQSQNGTPNNGSVPGMNTHENPDDLDSTRSQ